MNITKLAQERGEAIYATVKKKKSVSFPGVECPVLSFKCDSIV